MAEIKDDITIYELRNTFGCIFAAPLHSCISTLSSPAWFILPRGTELACGGFVPEDENALVLVSTHAPRRIRRNSGGRAIAEVLERVVGCVDCPGVDEGSTVAGCVRLDEMVGIPFCGGGGRLASVVTGSRPNTSRPLRGHHRDKTESELDPA